MWYHNKLQPLNIELNHLKTSQLVPTKIIACGFCVALFPTSLLILSSPSWYFPYQLHISFITQHKWQKEVMSHSQLILLILFSLYSFVFILPQNDLFWFRVILNMFRLILLLFFRLRLSNEKGLIESKITPAQSPRGTKEAQVYQSMPLLSVM